MDMCIGACWTSLSEAPFFTTRLGQMLSTCFHTKNILILAKARHTVVGVDRFYIWVFWHTIRHKCTYWVCNSNCFCPCHLFMRCCLFDRCSNTDTLTDAISHVYAYIKQKIQQESHCFIANYTPCSCIMCFSPLKIRLFTSFCDASCFPNCKLVYKMMWFLFPNPSKCYYVHPDAHNGILF